MTNQDTARCDDCGRRIPHTDEILCGSCRLRWHFLLNGEREPVREPGIPIAVAAFLVCLLLFLIRLAAEMCP